MHLVFSTRPPLGLAFDIPDLLLAQAVAEASGLRLRVEIDHHADGEELEEVIALYHGAGDACRCLIWRRVDSVVVQPIPGRPRYFASLSEALTWLAPERPEPLSDLTLSAAHSGLRRQTHADPGESTGGGRHLHPLAG